MGLFSNLKKAIFKKASNKPRATARQKPTNRPEAPKEPEATKSDADLSPATPVGSAQITPETPTPETNAIERLTAAELASQLDQMEKEHPEDLAWRTSIVDLMKLVEMDSSYAERKEMAIDLGYSEADIDSKGSAEMNMWLHKEVLAKLSEDTDGDLTTS